MTFSYSGVSEFQPVVEKQLRHNPRTNLAVVFEHTLPVWYLNREVINGDASDVRFNDAGGVVVGLTAKGKAKTDTSGFVVLQETYRQKGTVGFKVNATRAINKLTQLENNMNCDLCNSEFHSGDDRIGNVWIDGQYLTSCLECEEDQRELGKRFV